MSETRIEVKFEDFVIAQDPEESPDRVGVLVFKHVSDCVEWTVNDHARTFTGPEFAAMVAAAHEPQEKHVPLTLAGQPMQRRVLDRDPERGANVEIVARWRDRAGVTSMAPIELTALGNVLWDAADVPALRAERDALRARLPQLDCRRTGGRVSDLDGDHCPPEAPCMRCRLRRAEERVKHLEWEMNGSPMKGETP